MDKDSTVNNENIEEVEQGVDPEIVFSDDEYVDEDYDEDYDEDEDEDEESSNEDEDSESEAEPSDDEDDGNGLSEDSENEEESKKDSETEPVDSSRPSENQNAGHSDYGNVSTHERLVQEIAQNLDLADIPNTPEYRKSVIEQAKKATCKELNIEEDDFNNFDEEHQFIFSEKLQQVRDLKQKRFDSTVEKIRQKQNAEDNRNKIERLINSQCDTKEKKDSLYNAIRGASTGYTEDMRKELAQGKTDKLQRLINLATGKKNVVTRKSNKTNRETKAGRDRGLASDLVFGNF